MVAARRFAACTDAQHTRRHVTGKRCSLLRHWVTAQLLGARWGADKGTLVGPKGAYPGDRLLVEI